jgi:hypothetical protein
LVEIRRSTIHSLRHAVGLAMLAALVAAPARVLAFSMQQPGLPPPVALTAEQDHQRMMELLQITALRPGANPNDPQAPNAVNYDEAKANPYPQLPDPLVLKNGKRVPTARAWLFPDR